MKLLMTTDTVGGVWTYSLELCRALAPHGVEIALATLGGEMSPEQRAEAAALPHVTVHESRYRLCWMEDAWDDVAASRVWLREIADDFKPDVVHLNDLGGGADFPAPVVLVAHSCVFSWWQGVRGSEPPAEWERYQAEVSACVQAAELVVAPTEAMLRAFREYYGTPRVSAVIHNGRDWPPLVSPTALAAKQPQILTAGRLWDESKNLAALAAVAGELPWPVLAAGTSNGAPAPAGVTLLGHLPAGELAQHLEQSALYAAPARYEPFGLAILEAARAGCALVLGDIPSLREVWGEAATYAAPTEPAQLRDAIAALIDDPARRLALAESAQKRARNYSAARMAAGYLRRYRQLHPGAGATFSLPAGAPL